MKTHFTLALWTLGLASLPLHAQSAADASAISIDDVEAVDQAARTRLTERERLEISIANAALIAGGAFTMSESDDLVRRAEKILQDHARYLETRDASLLAQIDVESRQLYLDTAHQRRFAAGFRSAQGPRVRAFRSQVQFALDRAKFSRAMGAIGITGAAAVQLFVLADAYKGRLAQNEAEVAHELEELAEDASATSH